MPRRGRGGACCGGHGGNGQAGADGAALDGERVEQCADGAAACSATSPQGQAEACGVKPAGLLPRRASTFAIAIASNSIDDDRPCKWQPGKAPSPRRREPRTARNRAARRARGLESVRLACSLRIQVLSGFR